MRSTLITFSMVLLFLLSSCTLKHNYIWNEYPIAPERISSEISFDDGQEINIIKGKSNDKQILIATLGAHKYYGTEQSLTDGLVDQLAMEMRKRGLKINADSKKTLEITVVRTIFEKAAFKVATTMEYTVKCGDGKTKSYSTYNRSAAGIDKIYDGVVALSVIEIIQDPEILEYLKN